MGVDILNRGFWLIMLLSISNNTQGQWNIVSNDDDCIYTSVYFLNDSTGFVLGTCDLTNVIKKTTDFGETWQVVYSEEASYFYDIDFPTNELGYISAYGNVLKTLDQGETWFYANLELGGHTFRSIAFENELEGFGCFADGGSAFGKTFDGGETWIQDFEYGGREIVRVDECEYRMISGFYSKSDNCWDDKADLFLEIGNRFSASLSVLQGNHALICGLGLNQTTWDNFGFIGYSEDDGESWSVQDFNGIYGLRSVKFVNQEVAYCVGQPFYPNQHSFLKTTDGGLTWNYQIYEFPCTECYSPNIRDVFCVSENICYAVSSKGVIYRTLNGGGELFPMTISEYILPVEVSIFPNPVEDVATISSLEIIEKVLVYDYTGKQLKCVRNKANEIDINLSDIANGYYVLEIYFESGETQFERLIKK